MAERPAAPLLRRLGIYTAERFPLAAYVPMILVASFAALGYSRVARGAAGFASAGAFVTTAITLLAAFFALRVADEHKDAVVDRLTRPELPVPRGVVSLGELRAAAAVAAVVAVLANILVSPALLITLAIAALWLALMTREFLAREWLRARPAWYLASHMVIMPLLLLHATAVDWLAAGARPPRALAVFLAATYAAGLVLEVGRKVRALPDERPGVETYTSSWGIQRAVTVWLGALALSAALVGASSFVVYARWAFLAAPLLAFMAAAAALRITRAPGEAGAGRPIESASAVWTLAAYGLLALPWVERALR